MKKMLVMITMSILALSGCGKDNEHLVQTEAPVKQDVTTETDAIVDKEEIAVLDETEVKSSFPVPILKDGKEDVSLEELPKATQAALQWTFDYFNTEGIQTEDEFYQMMKEKHYIPYYPDKKIPEDLDKIELLLGGYGTEMLPAFTPGQKVEKFEIWPEAKRGLLIDIPIYIKIKGKENMHAIAIAYSTDINRVLGVDVKFPMSLD